MLPAAGLVLLIVTLLPHSLCQHHSLLAEIQGWPTNPADVANSPDDKRPTCVLINNYVSVVHQQNRSYTEGDIL